MNTKKVSVIIPMHNSSKHIKECVTSVLNQTYKNIELIVVDDKSTDNSIEMVQQFKDSRLKLIQLQQNIGAALARNKGIDHSTGDYICFIDSDDYWVLDKLEKQVNFIEKYDYIFIYSDYAYLKADGTSHIAHVPKSINYKQALKNTAIFTSTVMFNMKYLTKNDIYMPNIKRGQDTATWWKVLKRGIRAYAINEVLAYYRVGDKLSLSSNKFKALKRSWELYKREDISYIKKIYCFNCYVFNAIKRRL
ncbi:MAG: glycosyltransferase family 2 protein [Clostridia bacterium]|nr:glycosyltransferase family 2 protein [Clostridia bacterium]